MAIPLTALAQQQTFEFNIHAGSLGNALSQTASQAGILLNFDSKLTQGKNTTGFSGNSSTDAVLVKLLEGTGLHAQRLADGGYKLHQSSSGAPTLPPITVMEQRHSTEGTQVISSEEIELRLAKSTKDIFKSDPSISIGGGGSAHAQRLYLRGVEQSNLNVTIDGADQGRATHPGQSNIIRIDPSILKQVEVDTMPTADAGPGALGGAIRFTTVDAQELLEPGQDIGAKVRAGYSTVDKAETLGATVYTKVFDNIGLLANVTSVKSEDYRMGNGEKNLYTGEDNQNYFMKLSMLNRNGHSLKLTADQNEHEGQRTWTGSSEIGYVDENSTALANMSRKRQSTGIEHSYESDNPLFNTRIKLNQSKIKFNRTAMTTQHTMAPLDDLGLNNRIQTADLRNTAKFDVLGSKNQLIIGADHSDEKSNLVGSATNISGDNLGFYIQNRAYINDLTLSFGLRQDQYNAEQGKMKLKGDKLSPNLSATYKIANGFSVFGAYGEAVRGSGTLPAMFQVLLLDNPNATYNGKKLSENPEPFKPETSVKTEYGFNYLGRGLFSNKDKLKLKLTMFNIEMDNLIGGAPGKGGPTELFNIPTLTSKGWEVKAEYNPNSLWNTSLIYTDTTVEDKNGDFYISSQFNRSASSAGQRLAWDNKWYVTQDIFLGYTLTVTNDLKNKGELYRKGFATHDLQAMWVPSAFKGLELSLVVNNIFDETYSEITTLGDLDNDTVVFEPGRNARMQVSYKF